MLATERLENVAPPLAVDLAGEDLASRSETWTALPCVGETAFSDGGLRRGTDYMHARHYHPQLGRFLQIDPLAGSVSRPQSLNRYPYVSNRPLAMIDPDGRNEILHISEKDPCSFPIEVWCHIPTRPAWEEDPWPPFPPGGNGPRPPSPTPDDPDGDDEEDGEDEVREREEKECIANTYGVVGVMADKAGFWGVGALAAGVAKDLAIHGTAWIYGKTAENLVPLVGRQIATPGAASTLGFMAENALKWESVWAGVGKTLLATSVGATGFSIGMRMHCGSLDGDI